MFKIYYFLHKAIITFLVLYVKLKIVNCSLCSAMSKFSDAFLSKHWLHKSYQLCVFTLKLENTFAFLEEIQKPRVNDDFCGPTVCT